jgi:RNA-binding protein
MINSQQRKQLRGLAHHLDPVVMIGKAGLTEGVIAASAKALDAHELIKVRFLEFKDEKKDLAAQLAEATGSDIAGIIGHILILYKEHPEADRRKIELS